MKTWYSKSTARGAPPQSAEREIAIMNMYDMYSDACALYDGGWRAEDYDQLIAEYDLTTDEADALCAGLAELDEDIARRALEELDEDEDEDIARRAREALDIARRAREALDEDITRRRVRAALGEEAEQHD
jgi:hypothetical protein